MNRETSPDDRFMTVVLIIYTVILILSFCGSWYFSRQQRSNAMLDLNAHMTVKQEWGDYNEKVAGLFPAAKQGQSEESRLEDIRMGFYAGYASCISLVTVLGGLESEAEIKTVFKDRKKEIEEFCGDLLMKAAQCLCDDCKPQEVKNA